MFIVCPRNKQRHRSVELNLWMAREEPLSALWHQGANLGCHQDILDQMY